MALNLGLFDSVSVSPAIQVNGQKTHTFTIIPTGSVNISVIIEFSEDKLNWYNVTNSNYVINDSEVHNLTITENFIGSFYRFKYVSGTGEVKVHYKEF
jgi:hypothetical protein